MAEIIPPHGGYRHLKSFQVAQWVYDTTVRFCDRYIDRQIESLTEAFEKGGGFTERLYHVRSSNRGNR